MKTDRRLAGAALGLALFVAACGGSSSGSPAATSAGGGSSATPAPTDTAPNTGGGTTTASDAPTDAPASQDTSGNTGGGTGTAADLEALIPDKVGTTAMQKSSVDYSQLGLAGIPLDSTELDPYLKEKGKSISDMSMAMGIGEAGKPMVYIIRIKGVPASDFGPKLMSSATSGMDKKNIGGKDVYWTGAAGFTTAIYYADDKLVYILMASETDAAQILQGMP